MASVNTSTGTILSISPLLDEDAIFQSFVSTESINGDIPSIEVKIKTFRDLTSVKDKQHIKIVNQNGYAIESDCYVYGIEYLRGICSIKMMPVNGDFTRKIKTSTYRGGESVIGVFSGKVNKTVKSDILKDVYLYQKSETDYHFLTRFLKSYRKNTIFAYTLDGLIIRDLSNFKGLIGLNRQGNTNANDSTEQELSDPKRYESDIEILERFTNHMKVRVHGEIYDVNNEYETLLGNYGFFERFNAFKSLYNFSTPELLEANLCEGINYYSTETKVEKTIISSRKIQITGTDITIAYSLRSINPLSK